MKAVEEWIWDEFQELDEQAALAVKEWNTGVRHIGNAD